MPNGQVKLINSASNFGLLADEAGYEYYVAGDDVSRLGLQTGDHVAFESQDSDTGRRKAVSIEVTKKAPPHTPVGLTMAAPPAWDDLEERERQRRMARRRRR